MPIRQAICATFLIYFRDLLKGYPGHRQLTVQLDTKEPRVTFLNLLPTSDRFFFTRDRVWIERLDSTITEDRSSPRAAFAGHKRETPWDHLHFLYFIGYVPTLSERHGHAEELLLSRFEELRETINRTLSVAASRRTRKRSSNQEPKSL